jgi:hypothetical protein
MDHIGIDVHKKESQICILAEGGELIERRVGTEADRFAAVLGDRFRAWALRIAARRGKYIAVVALARCLAGILYALLPRQHGFRAAPIPTSGVRCPAPGLSDRGFLGEQDAPSLKGCSVFERDLHTKIKCLGTI